MTEAWRSAYTGEPCGYVCGIPEDAHQTEDHLWEATAPAAEPVPLTLDAAAIRTFIEELSPGTAGTIGIPRTEAGRRLLAKEAYNSRSFALITAEDIRAIESPLLARIAELEAGVTEAVRFIANEGRYPTAIPLSTALRTLRSLLAPAQEER